ncbi:hypothetical protein CC2G_013266 [Coprinopsis cinerea AmutBmut pab1-1]|nr:hypothetical protein CC2G_013266 [Coprinopsis cinerea AmutBmut pab1-1]
MLTAFECLYIQLTTPETTWTKSWADLNMHHGLVKAKWDDVVLVTPRHSVRRRWNEREREEMRQLEGERRKMRALLPGLLEIAVGAKVTDNVSRLWRIRGPYRQRSK